MLFQEPEETDNVTFTFDCHDKEWQLKISRIDKELIRVKLQGERNYDFYMRAGDRYDTMVRVATQEGYQEPNKPFPAGNED